MVCEKSGTQNRIKRLNAVETLPIAVSSSRTVCQPDKATGTRGPAQGERLQASFALELVPDLVVIKIEFGKTKQIFLMFSLLCVWRWFNGFNWEGLKARSLPSPLKRAVSQTWMHRLVDLMLRHHYVHQHYVQFRILSSYQNPHSASSNHSNYDL